MVEAAQIKCQQCKLKSNVVSILTANELCLLEEGCFQVNFNKGEQIFKEGMPVQYITYIREGFVKICKKGINGKDMILSISKQGAYLGIHNLNMKRHENYLSAYALTNSNICFIQIDCFKKLLTTNGEFATAVISYVFDDEMNYFERLVNNIYQQLPGRLANALLYFYHDVFCNPIFELNLNRTELASLIGTSRESVGRLLKEFQEEGLISIKRNRFQILESEKLEMIKSKG